MTLGRIRAPIRGDHDASELEAYDAIMARVATRGEAEPSPYLTAMLSTPTIGAALNEVGRAIRLAPTRAAGYSHRDFELIVHALSIDVGLVEQHHVLDALAQGVSADALESLLRGTRRASATTTGCWCSSRGAWSRAR